MVRMCALSRNLGKEKTLGFVISQATFVFVFMCTPGFDVHLNLLNVPFFQEWNFHRNSKVEIYQLTKDSLMGKETNLYLLIKISIKVLRKE